MIVGASAHGFVEGDTFAVFDGSELGTGGHDRGEEHRDGDAKEESDKQTRHCWHDTEIDEDAANESGSPDQPKGDEEESLAHRAFDMTREVSIEAVVDQFVFELLGDG